MKSIAKHFTIGLVIGLAIVGIAAIFAGFDAVEGCKR